MVTGKFACGDELLDMHAVSIDSRAQSSKARTRISPPKDFDSERTLRQIQISNILKLEKLIIAGRRGGDRTRKPLRAGDFKSPVYTIPPPAHSV